MSQYCCYVQWMAFNLRVSIISNGIGLPIGMFLENKIACNSTVTVERINSISISISNVCYFKVHDYSILFGYN